MAIITHISASRSSDNIVSPPGPPLSQIPPDTSPAQPVGPAHPRVLEALSEPNSCFPPELILNVATVIDATISSFIICQLPTSQLASPPPLPF